MRPARSEDAANPCSGPFVNDALLAQPGAIRVKCSVGAAVVYAYTGTRPPNAAQPTLVFLHGAGHDHSVWALQSRYFAHHGFNVYAVDLPGHGRSSGDALPSVEAIAGWVPQFLDAIGANTAVLAGHSMGALAALECAARFADRITRVALLGPAAPMEVSDALLEAAANNEPLAYELITGWSFSAKATLGGNANPGLWMTGNALRLLARTRPRVLATDLMACKRYAGGIEAAAFVRCPALLILARRDIMAPPRQAAALAAALKDKEVITLPECGHALMAEAPDAVLEALKAFLLQEPSR